MLDQIALWGMNTVFWIEFKVNSPPRLYPQRQRSVLKGFHISDCPVYPQQWGLTGAKHLTSFRAETASAAFCFQLRQRSHRVGFWPPEGRWQNKAPPPAWQHRPARLTGKWDTTPHGSVATGLSCIYSGRHNNFLMSWRREVGVGVRGYGRKRPEEVCGHAVWVSAHPASW